MTAARIEIYHRVGGQVCLTTWTRRSDAGLPPGELERARTRLVTDMPDVEFSRIVPLPPESSDDHADA